MILPLIALFTIAGARQAQLTTVNLVGNSRFANADAAEWNTNASSLDVLAVNQPAFKYAARLTFRPKAGGNPWDVVLSTPAAYPVTKGKTLTIRAWIRSSTSSRIGVNFEQARDPYTKMISQVATPSPTWKEYEFDGVADKDYAQGEAQLTIYLGYEAGSVDLANVRVETLGEKESTGPVAIVPEAKLSNGEQSGWAPTALSSFTTVAAGQPNFARAVMATFANNPNGSPWAISLHAASTGKVRVGHTVYMQAWLRSPTSSKICLIFEHASDPFTKSIESVLTLSPQWKEYRVAGVSTATYEPGQAQLTIFLNYGTGSVEIGDIRADDIGVKPLSSLPVTIAYYTKPPSDAWRAPALARIEKYRKGDLTVKVRDSHGHPISGATVKIDQIRQDFRFGTAVPASLIVAKGQIADRFRTYLLRFFNTVVFGNDLKWHQLGAEDYTDVDAAIKWLDEHGFRIRGHNLVWGSFQYLPKGLEQMSNEQIVAALRRRIVDAVSRFKGKVYIWDVVNEAATERALWDRIGWDKFVDVYKWAREVDPNVQLCYNDYNWTEEEAVGTNQRNVALSRVKMLIEQGAPLDVIGLQSHDEPPLTAISRVIEIVNNIAKLGKKLEVTEYDLSVQNDKFHGEYMRDFLTAMYSIPQVQSFVMWGFWEGDHWRASEGGAMVRRDWTLRPAAKIWEDLTRRQWWTKASGKTDEGGTLRTRAFYGTLKVTVSAQGKTAVEDVAVSPGKAGSVMITIR